MPVRKSPRHKAILNYSPVTELFPSTARCDNVPTPAVVAQPLYQTVLEQSFLRDSERELSFAALEGVSVLAPLPANDRRTKHRRSPSLRAANYELRAVCRVNHDHSMA